MSTSAQALAAARGLQEAMGDYGVACIIQLRRGVSRSGWLNPVSNWSGVMSHHIASARTHGTTPFYNLVRTGRTGLPGPLANGYGGWDKRYRIITMGWANHPGAGGPITLNGRRIPRDNGRPYFWGTEYEGGLRASDWQHEDFHGWMATCNAAILDWLGLPTSAHIEHLTWAPGRKIDRLGYTTQSGRDRIRAVRGKKGVSMALTDADVRKIWQYKSSTENRDAYSFLRRAVNERPSPEDIALAVWGYRGRDEPRDAYSFQRNTHRMVAAAAGEREGLLKAIEQVAAGREIDLDEIRQATADGVTDALGSLEAEVTLNINTDQDED